MKDDSTITIMVHCSNYAIAGKSIVKFRTPTKTFAKQHFSYDFGFSTTKIPFKG